MKKVPIAVVGSAAVLAGVLFFVVIFNVQKINTLVAELTTTHEQLQEPQEYILDLSILQNILQTADSISSKKYTTYFLSNEQKLLLTQIEKVSPGLKTVLQELSQGEHKWLFIFQNSNELRPTGGFMGSYALLEVKDGKLITITVEDIYDADGQFTGFFPAPEGVLQYLSSGKGLRLPDANWHPDTEKSAQHILPFFALGNKNNITGITFVTLDFAKELLAFLGPIELSDYNTIVTQDNIDSVLRSRRAEFFPGSIQKKHLLSLLLTQIRLKLLSLSTEELNALFALVAKQTQTHALQFYSNNQAIDQVFTTHNLRQVVMQKEAAEYLYLVESNVGINKANQHVERNVQITKKDNTRTVTIDFTNTNLPPQTSKLTTASLDTEDDAKAQAQGKYHNSYVNYQRVLVPETWLLDSVVFDQTTFSDTDIAAQTLDTAQHTLNSFGFLVVVPEQTTKTLTLTFNVPESSSFDTIYIQKQPGTPQTQYTLEYNHNQKAYTLNQNEILSYP